MVQKIPGTNIDLPLRNNASNEEDSCFFRCMMTPLSIVGAFYYLFAIAFAFSLLYWPVQALHVGSQTYQKSECSYQVGVWLLVFGATLVGSFCLLVSSVVCFVATQEDIENSRGSIFANFVICYFGGVILFAIGWICYGVTIVYNPGTLRECDPSQYAVFERMVLFLFYGLVSLFGPILIFCCCLFLMIPCCANVDEDEDEAYANPQRQRDREAAAAEVERNRFDIEAQRQARVLSPPSIGTSPESIATFAAAAGSGEVPKTNQAANTSMPTLPTTTRKSDSDGKHFDEVVLQ